MSRKKKALIISIVSVLVIVGLVIGGLAIAKSVTNTQAEGSATQFLFRGSTVVGYIGENKEITIPASYSINDNNEFVDGDSIKVDAIAGGAFKGTGITKITVGSHIISIDDHMFEGCDDLKEVDISAISITEVPTSMFSGLLMLEKVSLPNSVKSFAQGAFNNCLSLKEINIPEKVKYIPINCFIDCKSLEKINLNNVNIIQKQAFAGCEKLQEINTDKVTEFGQSAFAGCESLKSINLTSAKTLGLQAFARSGLKNVDISVIENLGDSVFSNCENLERVTFGKQKSLGYRMFYGAIKLNNVVLPEGMTMLNHEVFAYCHGLTEIALPSTLTIIGNQVFYNSGLTEINIPASLDSFGREVFTACENLKTVTINSTYLYNALTSDSAIGGIISNAEVIKVLASVDNGFNTYLSDYNSFIKTTEGEFNIYTRGQGEPPVEPEEPEPEEPVEVSPVSDFTFSGSYITGYNGTATEIVLPTSYSIVDGQITEGADIKLTGLVWYIGTSPNLANVKKLVIPEGYITSKGACQRMSSLEEVSIPASLTSAGDGLFSNCKNLVKATFANGTITVPTFIFGGCEKLSEVILPETVTTIKNYAFSGTAITSLDFLPDSITTLESGAFADCTKLIQAVVPGVQVVPDNLLNGCLRLATVVFSEGTEEIGDYVLFDNDLLQNIKFPTTLKQIGEHNLEPSPSNSIILEINSVEIYKNPGKFVYSDAEIRVLATVDDGTSEAFKGLVKRVDGDYNVYTRY